MSDISSIVAEVVDELLAEKREENPSRYQRPADLNNGDCPTVASRILNRVPDAERQTGITVFDGMHRRRYPAHTWVVYDGLCYDAECTHGTPHWHDLPIFHGTQIDRRHVTPKYRTGKLDEYEWGDRA